jgi:molybdopterin synthase sulfur carrier subunit
VPPALARYRVPQVAHRDPGSEGAALQVRVRLGAGLARLSGAPLRTVDLADGATVDDLYARLRAADPDLAPALRSALPVVAGEHVARDRPLADREEVALLLPVSGG